MSVQNPTIPTPTQAKGIDLIVLDLQTHLDTELVWLTNGMGRGYRLSKVRTNQTTVFLPEVYLGNQNISYNYFSATPDNDKQGQSVFFVGDATLPDQQKGFYGWVEYPVSIIFNANLKTIDSALLATEDFTEHLIQGVREALIRDLVGKSYRLEIDSIQREFEDVYAEFDVSNDRGIAHLPLTHFRVNCTVIFKEDCTGVSLDRCAAILQNLSSDEKLNCVLPTYDFSSTATQSATTAQQQADMTAWLCTPVVVPPPSSLIFDGVNEYVIIPTNAAYEFTTASLFTLSGYFKPTTSKVHNLFNKFSTAGIDRGIFCLILSNETVRFDIQSNGGLANLRAITTSSITLNVWTRLDFVYKGVPSGANIEIYFDGVLQPTTITDNLSPGDPIDDPTLPWHIGISNQLTNPFNGLAHELKFYNTALTAVDILADDAALKDFNNGITSSYTPVKDANVIFRNRTGADAVFGVTDWCFPDESGTVSGSQSVNMEEADKTTLDYPT